MSGDITMTPAVVNNKEEKQEEGSAPKKPRESGGVMELIPWFPWTMPDWLALTADQRTRMLAHADVPGPHSPSVAKLIKLAASEIFPLFGAIVAGFLGPLDTSDRWQSYDEWFRLINTRLDPRDRSVCDLILRGVGWGFVDVPVIDGVARPYPKVPRHEKLMGTVIGHYGNETNNLVTHLHWVCRVQTENNYGPRDHYVRECYSPEWRYAPRAFATTNHFIYKAEERMLANARKGVMTAKHLDEVYNACNLCSAVRLPLVVQKLTLGNRHIVKPRQGDRYCKPTPELLRAFCPRCTGVPNPSSDTLRYQLRWLDGDYVHPDDSKDNWSMGQTELYASCVLAAAEAPAVVAVAAAPAKRGKGKGKRKRAVSVDEMRDD